MNISFEKLTITISNNEAYTLYATLKRALEQTIKDHWKNYPDAYKEREQERLYMMRELARFTGNDFNYDSAELDKLLATLSQMPPSIA